jgi:hypothetical protein
MRKPFSSDEYTRRLLTLVKQNESGCWIFQGRVSSWGYGVFSVQREGVAHRAMYRLIYGPIPKGMRVCHTCDVRLCVNPTHLWLGTQQENIKDCSDKKRHTNGAKTHCKQGHEFTPENTLVTDAGKGRKRRQCKACHRIQQRMRAGWTQEQAETMGAVPPGREPVNANWKRKTAQNRRIFT